MMKIILFLAPNLAAIDGSPAQSISSVRQSLSTSLYPIRMNSFWNCGISSFHSLGPHLNHGRSHFLNSSVFTKPRSLNLPTHFWPLLFCEWFFLSLKQKKETLNRRMESTWFTWLFSYACFAPSFWPMRIQMLWLFVWGCAAYFCVRVLDPQLYHLTPSHSSKTFPVFTLSLSLSILVTWKKSQKNWRRFSKFVFLILHFLSEILSWVQLISL